MDYYAVVNDTEGEREATIFDGDELKYALIRFLSLQSSERKVTLTYVGEEYEEE